jgi:hypothetical protein
VAIVALAVVALPALGVGAVGTAAIVTVDRIAEELPDPSALEDLSFAEPTTVWDRSGKVQLGIFQKEQRRVVTFDEVPRLVLDATTTAEDRSCPRSPRTCPGPATAAARRSRSSSCAPACSRRTSSRLAPTAIDAR